MLLCTGALPHARSVGLRLHITVRRLFWFVALRLRIRLRVFAFILIPVTLWLHVWLFAVDSFRSRLFRTFYTFTFAFTFAFTVPVYWFCIPFLRLILTLPPCTTVDALPQLILRFLRCCLRVCVCWFVLCPFFFFLMRLRLPTTAFHVWFVTFTAAYAVVVVCGSTFPVTYVCICVTRLVWLFYRLLRALVTHVGLPVTHFITRTRLVAFWRCYVCRSVFVVHARYVHTHVLIFARGYAVTTFVVCVCTHVYRLFLVDFDFRLRCYATFTQLLRCCCVCPYVCVFLYVCVTFDHIRFYVYVTRLFVYVVTFAVLRWRLRLRFTFCCVYRYVAFGYALCIYVGLRSHTFAICCTFTFVLRIRLLIWFLRFAFTVTFHAFVYFTFAFYIFTHVVTFRCVLLRCYVALFVFTAFTFTFAFGYRSFSHVAAFTFAVVTVDTRACCTVWTFWIPFTFTLVTFTFATALRFTLHLHTRDSFSWFAFHPAPLRTYAVYVLTHRLFYVSSFGYVWFCCVTFARLILRTHTTFTHPVPVVPRSLIAVCGWFTFGCTHGGCIWLRTLPFTLPVTGWFTLRCRSGCGLFAVVYGCLHYTFTCRSPRCVWFGSGYPHTHTRFTVRSYFTVIRLRSYGYVDLQFPFAVAVCTLAVLRLRLHRLRYVPFTTRLRCVWLPFTFVCSARLPQLLPLVTLRARFDWFYVPVYYVLIFVWFPLRLIYVPRFVGWWLDLYARRYRARLHYPFVTDSARSFVPVGCLRLVVVAHTLPRYVYVTAFFGLFHHGCVSVCVYARVYRTFCRVWLRIDSRSWSLPFQLDYAPTTLRFTLLFTPDYCTFAFGLHWFHTVPALLITAVYVLICSRSFVLRLLVCVAVPRLITCGTDVAFTVTHICYVTLRLLPLDPVDVVPHTRFTFIHTVVDYPLRHFRVYPGRLDSPVGYAFYGRTFGYILRFTRFVRYVYTRLPHLPHLLPCPCVYRDLVYVVTIVRLLLLFWFTFLPVWFTFALIVVGFVYVTCTVTFPPRSRCHFVRLLRFAAQFPVILLTLIVHYRVTFDSPRTFFVCRVDSAVYTYGSLLRTFCIYVTFYVTHVYPFYTPVDTFATRLRVGCVTLPRFWFAADFTFCSHVYVYVCVHIPRLFVGLRAFVVYPSWFVWLRSFWMRLPGLLRLICYVYHARSFLVDRLHVYTCDYHVLLRLDSRCTFGYVWFYVLPHRWLLFTLPVLFHARSRLHTVYVLYVPVSWVYWLILRLPVTHILTFCSAFAPTHVCACLFTALFYDGYWFYRTFQLIYTRVHACLRLRFTPQFVHRARLHTRLIYGYLRFACYVYVICVSVCPVRSFAFDSFVGFWFCWFRSCTFVYVWTFVCCTALIDLLPVTARSHVGAFSFTVDLRSLHCVTVVGYVLDSQFTILRFTRSTRSPLRARGLHRTVTVYVTPLVATLVVAGWFAFWITLDSFTFGCSFRLWITGCYIYVPAVGRLRFVLPAAHTAAVTSSPLLPFVPHTYVWLFCVLPRARSATVYTTRFTLRLRTDSLPLRFTVATRSVRLRLRLPVVTVTHALVWFTFTRVTDYYTTFAVIPFGWFRGCDFTRLRSDLIHGCYVYVTPFTVTVLRYSC